MATKVYLLLIGAALMLLLGARPGVARPAAGPSLAFYDYPQIPPGQVRDTFSASLDNAVYMRSTWAGVLGPHTAHYRVYSPDHAFYQDVHVAFTGGAASTTVVWGVLPIAGTWMARLPGVWRVDLALDNDPTVLISRQFTLTW